SASVVMATPALKIPPCDAALGQDPMELGGDGVDVERGVSGSDDREDLAAAVRLAGPERDLPRLDFALPVAPVRLGEPVVDVGRARGRRALAEVAGAARRDQARGPVQGRPRKDGQGPEYAARIALGLRASPLRLGRRTARPRTPASAATCPARIS